MVWGVLRNTGFCPNKHGEKCPKASLKTPPSITTNTTIDGPTSYEKYLVWSTQTWLEMSRGLLQNTGFSRHKHSWNYPEVSFKTPNSINAKHGWKSPFKKIWFWSSQTKLEVSQGLLQNTCFCVCRFVGSGTTFVISLNHSDFPLRIVQALISILSLTHAHSESVNINSTPYLQCI